MQSVTPIHAVQQALAAGRLDLALQASAQWAALEPAAAPARIYLSGLCHRLSALSAAANQARIATALDPGMARPLDALGVIAADQGETAEAVKLSYAAMTRAPQDPNLLVNFGSALRAGGQPAAAARVLLRAVALAPALDTGPGADARYNLANALSASTVWGALRLFLQIARARPQDHRTLGNIGHLLNRLGIAEINRHMLEICVAVSPGYAAGHLNLGNAHRDQRDFGRAALLYERALALDGTLDAARVNRFETAMHAGDIVARNRLQPWILRHIEDAIAKGDPGLVAPMTLLHLPVVPDVRRRQADLLAAQLRSAYPPLAARPIQSDGPLTIGYLSGDFRDHAIGHLMAGLFAAHDRSRVRVVALSTGPDDDSQYRRAYEQDAGLFVDAAGMSDSDLITTIQAQKVDILVDVSGHTRFDRLPVVAARPAPLQVHFLGFPGPIGSGLVDWMIADPVLAEGAAHLPNPLAILPDCYQANDSHQPIGDAGNRADHGLPDGGFVFAGLVAVAKLGPETLSLWARTVAPVPDAVLWLLSPGPSGERMLRAALADLGLPPGRVVFAGRCRKADHLARHRHADLALDSLIYGGHTTTSDALWAGLPVLTLKGDGFAAQVAASLLTAVGLPDMITSSEETFSGRAKALAADPLALAEVRNRLAANRLTKPLFDTARFALHMEDAFETMAGFARRGTIPDSFRVPPRP